MGARRRETRCRIGIEPERAHLFPQSSHQPSANDVARRLSRDQEDHRRPWAAAAAAEAAAREAREHVRWARGGATASQIDRYFFFFYKWFFFDRQELHDGAQLARQLVALS